ncbi:hypothetical protein [Streptomyces sp. NPDC048590]|uniref:hypothetical protein n=1 Tax=Streptomyces sp. NPDC048590 TaxID=3365574 RepID=UPI00371C06CA
MPPAHQTEAARSPGPALELLVHGVGGTTPQEMLGDPRTTRITGDATAAVHRRTEDVGAEEHLERHRDGPVAEAYCWSNLTSGDGSRALWLLLLPFMVVNLAHWMRPTARGSDRAVRVYGLLVRLIALSLTVLLTAAACEVALDLVAWQCAGAPECSRRRSWLGFLSAHQDGWFSQPGRRLALAAAVPAVLVGLLWYLSNRTWGAYESQRPLTGGEADGPDADVDTATGSAAEPETSSPVTPALARPGFWYGRRLVARLRAAHTAAGLLTVAAAVGGTAVRYDRTVGSPVPAVAGALLGAGIALCGLVVVAVVCHRGRSERHLDDRLDEAVTSCLPVTSLGLLLCAVVYAGWSRPDWESSGTLPGESAFRVLTLGQGLLVVLLAAVALFLHRRAPEPRTTLRGLGGPVVAMLACALGGVMTGGSAQRVADWLDGPGTPGMGAGADIPGPPVLLSWQASVIPVLLVLLLPPLVWLAVRTVRRARRMGPGIEAEYGEPRPEPGRTRQIARTRAAAALTDSAPGVLGLLSAAALLLGTAAVTGSWLTGEVPGLAANGSGPFVESLAETAQSTGSWLTGFGVIAFVTWGRRAYRDVSARRTIGILWDVGTFWPRAAHPFAPPCYAERAVPDLTSRMCAWTGHTRGRLVISGHSQGSVLAAAAVWQLPDAARGRVALLTYGSPIERLYGRWFPAYFGRIPLEGLQRSVHCWRNLWRETDPIGGPVRIAEGQGPEIDRGPLRDPLVHGRTVEHPLPEPVLGHSDYQADPVFAEERAALLERLNPVLPQQPAGEGRGHGVQGSAGRSSG